MFMNLQFSSSDLHCIDIDASFNPFDGSPERVWGFYGFIQLPWVGRFWIQRGQSCRTRWSEMVETAAKEEASRAARNKEWDDIVETKPNTQPTGPQ